MNELERELKEIDKELAALVEQQKALDKLKLALFERRKHLVNKRQ